MIKAEGRLWGQWPSVGYFWFAITFVQGPTGMISWKGAVHVAADQPGHVNARWQVGLGSARDGASLHWLS